MKIDYPQSVEIDSLRRIWQEAFGDPDEFLDGFFHHIFSPDRCRCVTVDGEVAAALYWFDCKAYDRPMAYLYAIATAKSHRKKGLCRALMADTHALLEKLGYAGCLLVPEGEKLFGMYANLGYSISSGIREFSCRAGEIPTSIRELDIPEYAQLRRKMLPEGSVLQEGENLAYLSQLAKLYAGEDFILCARVENGQLYCPELLGNAEAAPGILRALGAASGTFHSPGHDRHFAMYHPLSDAPVPTYFGLAFD